MSWLTHKQVEILVDNLMVSLKWTRVRNQKDLFSGQHPDRLFVKGEDIVVMEIKPENAQSTEIVKGIGQATCFLPYKVKPYLVLSEQWARKFKDVLNELSGIGVLQYSTTGELSFFQKSERNIEKLKPLMLLKVTETKLTRELIWDFLLTLKDGLYSISFFEEALRETYPTIKIERQTIGRILRAMGFERLNYNYEKSKPYFQQETPFNIKINRRLMRE